MHKKYTVPLSLLSFVMLLGAGCSSSTSDGTVTDTTNTTTEKKSDTAVETTNEKKEYRINEEAILNDVSYMVTSVELFEKEIPTSYHNYPDTIGEPKKADAKRDWLRVELSITNNAKETLSTFGSTFVVENSAEQKIDFSNDTTSYTPQESNPLLSSDIAPAATNKYVLYFDIPEKSKELVLHVPDIRNPFSADADLVTFSLKKKEQ